jgi:hypothetical protein
MPESLMQTPVLAAIVAIVVAFSKVIEVILSKAMPQKSILTDIEREQLKSIHEVHARTDQDGTPLVYMPRTFLEIQRDLQKTLAQIVTDQGKIALILERLDKRLEKDN